MYQIVRITDREGVAKADSADRERLGCIGEAKMDEGCVLIHCRYDRRETPATSTSAPAWSSPGRRTRRPAALWWRRSTASTTWTR